MAGFSAMKARLSMPKGKGAIAKVAAKAQGNKTAWNKTGSKSFGAKAKGK